jgi:hypothetical protein
MYLAGGDIWYAVHGLFSGFDGYTLDKTACFTKVLLQAVIYFYKKGIIH